MDLNTQADGLKQPQSAATPFAPAPTQPSAPERRFSRFTRVIAVTSGKGGVGKTNVTANLAIALTRLGRKVMILDADLGLANIDILLGIRPAYNISHVIYGTKTLQEILVKGPEGILVVPASSGISDLANLGPEERRRLIEAFNAYQDEVDVLLIDTSAGIAENVIGFVTAADEGLLITTPEPTSITDAYAMLKVVARTGKTSMGILLNRAHNTEEANQILRRITMIAKRFLNFDLVDFGFLFEDPAVNQCVRKQIPFLIDSPNSAVARGVRDLARRVLNIPAGPDEHDHGINRFLRKITSFVAAKRGEE